MDIVFEGTKCGSEEWVGYVRFHSLNPPFNTSGGTLHLSLLLSH